MNDKTATKLVNELAKIRKELEKMNKELKKQDSFTTSDNSNTLRYIVPEVSE